MLILCGFVAHPLEAGTVASLRFGKPCLRLVLVLGNAVAVEIQPADVHHRDAIARVGSFGVQLHGLLVAGGPIPKGQVSLVPEITHHHVAFGIARGGGLGPRLRMLEAGFHFHEAIGIRQLNHCRSESSDRGPLKQPVGDEIVLHDTSPRAVHHRQGKRGSWLSAIRCLLIPVRRSRIVRFGDAVGADHTILAKVPERKLGLRVSCFGFAGLAPNTGFLNGLGVP